MVNQCVNTRCWMSPQDHGSKCTSCGRPSISTPDAGSSYENSPQAQISSSFGGFSHGNPSPANSSPFFIGQTSPTSYGSPTIMHDAPAYSHPHPVHNPPAPHASPALRNVHSPYQRSGYNPRTAIPIPHPTALNLSTMPIAYSPSSTSTLNYSSRSLGQSDALPDTSFEIYDPKADKSAKDKQRSCISCYRGNRQCRTDKGETCCQSCKGKSKYCRGVVQTPGLVDTQPWFQSTAALIAGGCSSSDMDLENVYLFDIQVTLNVSSPKDEDLARARAQIPPNYQLDLRGLRNNTTASDDHSKLAEILDLVYPSATTAIEESANAKPDILESLTCFCRRFVTCLMTLRNFQVCTINTTFRDESLAPYIILEFLRLLSSEANYLFWKIFEALNTFLDGPRQKHSFSKQLMTVASSLGQIHQALKSFDSGLEDGSIPLPHVTALRYSSPVALEELEHLGHFFNPIGFRAGPGITPAKLPGIHIEFLSPDGGLVDRVAKRQLGETVTFFDLLQRSFFVDIAQTTATADFFEPKSPPIVEGLSSSVESSCQNAISGKSTLPPHQLASVDGQSRGLPPRERRELEEQCRVKLSDLQTILKEENERHRIRKLELEEEICLLSLSLGLDVPTQNNVRAHWPVENENNQPGPMMQDSSPSPGAVTLVDHSDDHNGKAHIHTNSGGNPGDEPVQSFPTDLGATEMIDTVMSSSVSGHGSEDTAYNVNDHVFPAVSKRKRISDYFPSFKKPRVVGTADETSSSQPSSMNFTSSLILPKSGSVSGNPKTSGLPVKTRISQILSCHPSPLNRKLPTHAKTLPCKDIVPAMPQSNPGSNRPLSWPRSHRWRKSFGVSVKALREGFEKMKIEQVEPVPPLPPSI